MARVRWDVIEQGTLEEIEKHVQEIGQMLAAALLIEVALRLQERDGWLVMAGVCCPKCNQTFEFSQPGMMTFETHLGQLRVWRSYLACRRCKVYFHPLDAALQAPKRGEMAPVFGTALSLLGVEATYGTGSRLLAALANRKLDKSTIDHQVQRDGGCLQQLEREEADALWPHDAEGHARKIEVAEVLKTKGFLLSLPPRPGKVLVMQVDGAMSNLAQEPDVKAEKAREQKKALEKAHAAKEAGTSEPEDTGDSAPSSFRESLHLVIYRMEDVVKKPIPVPNGQKRRKLKFRSIITRKQYAAVVNDPPMFAKQINRLARLWDYKAYPVRILLGDGAEKNWTAGQYFEPTIEVLDINHARDHIRECARVLYDTKKAKTWGRRWCKHLEKHGPELLLTHLSQLTKETWSEAAANKLKNLRKYCEENKHRMNYPLFIKLGYPIASGAIEGANSHLFADRCRRTGQQWRRDKLQALLALRCASRDGRWEHVLRAVRRQQAYPALPQPSSHVSPPVEEQAAAPPPAPPQRYRRLEQLIPVRKQIQILRSRQGPSPLEPIIKAATRSAP